MKDNFTLLGFEKIFNIEKIITIFYMEFSKSFCYDGESHDFWEIVYIDKGEMICTADKKRFVLKSGEMTFHKPNEFHNLSGNNAVVPNVSIITFQCKSRAMKYFEGKIFKLSSEEKTLLSNIITEGTACFELVDPQNPLLQKMNKLKTAPFGSSQMVKNYLEIFLIMLYRNTNVLTKKMRQSYLIDGIDVPYKIKKILNFLQENVHQKLTVADIANHFGKSESAIKQLFFQYHKSGIINYFNQLKINEAKKLIREGTYNFSQISSILGYDNPQYFSKSFKTIAKMTPKEYKASILNKK